MSGRIPENPLSIQSPYCYEESGTDEGCSASSTDVPTTANGFCDNQTGFSSTEPPLTPVQGPHPSAACFFTPNLSSEGYPETLPPAEAPPIPLSPSQISMQARRLLENRSGTIFERTERLIEAARLFDAARDTANLRRVETLLQSLREPFFSGLQLEFWRIRDLPAPERLEQLRSLVSTALAFGPEGEGSARIQEAESMIQLTVLEIAENGDPIHGEPIDEKTRLVVQDLSDRLHDAIRQGDHGWIAGANAASVREFSESSRMAHELLAEGETLSSAEVFADLGLDGRVSEALARDLDNALALDPSQSAPLLLRIAQIQQRAGMIASSDGTLAELEILDQPTADSDVRETAKLARAMRFLTRGQLTEAKEILQNISANETARVLLTSLEQGERNLRLTKIVGVLRGISMNYIERGRESDENMDSVEQDTNAGWDEVARLLVSGESQTIREAINRVLDDDRFPNFTPGTNESGVGSNTDYFLYQLAHHPNDDRLFAREAMTLAESLSPDGYYSAAGNIYQMLAQDAEYGDIAASALESIPSEARVRGAFTPFQIFTSGTDSLQSAENFAGLFVPFGLARAAGVGTEAAFAVRAATSLARSPIGFRLAGFGVRSTTEAMAFTTASMALQSLFTGRTDNWTPDEFARGVGAMLVTFGLLHAVGPVAQRFGGIGRWAGGVAGFTFADYLNRWTGLHHEDGASFLATLTSSVVMDAEMRAAGVVAERVSGGRLGQLEQLSQIIYQQPWIGGVVRALQIAEDGREQHPLEIDARDAAREGLGEGVLALHDGPYIASGDPLVVPGVFGIATSVSFLLRGLRTLFGRRGPTTVSPDIAEIVRRATEGDDTTKALVELITLARDGNEEAYQRLLPFAESSSLARYYVEEIDVQRAFEEEGSSWEQAIPVWLEMAENGNFAALKQLTIGVNPWSSLTLRTNIVGHLRELAVEEFLPQWRRTFRDDDIRGVLHLLAVQGNDSVLPALEELGEDSTWIKTTGRADWLAVGKIVEVYETSPSGMEDLGELAADGNAYAARALETLANEGNARAVLIRGRVLEMQRGVSEIGAEMESLWNGIEGELQSLASGGNREASDALSYVGQRSFRFRYDEAIRLIYRGNRSVRDLFIAAARSKLANDVVEKTRRVIEMGIGERNRDAVLYQLQHLASAGNEAALSILRGAASVNREDALRLMESAEVDVSIVSAGSWQAAEPTILRMAEQGHIEAARALLNTGRSYNPNIAERLAQLDISALVAKAAGDERVVGVLSGLARNGHIEAQQVVERLGREGNPLARHLLARAADDREFRVQMQSRIREHNAGKLLFGVRGYIEWLRETITSSGEASAEPQSRATILTIEREGLQFVNVPAEALRDPRRGFLDAFRRLDESDQQRVLAAFDLAIESLQNREAFEALLARAHSGDPVALEARDQILSANWADDISWYQNRISVTHDLKALDALIFLERLVGDASRGYLRELADLNWIISNPNDRIEALIILARLCLLENKEAYGLLRRIADEGDAEVQQLVELVDYLQIFTRSGENAQVLAQALAAISNFARQGSEMAVESLVQIAESGNNSAAQVLKALNINNIKVSARSELGAVRILWSLSEWGNMEAAEALLDLGLSPEHLPQTHSALVQIDPTRIYDDMMSLPHNNRARHLQILEGLRNAGNQMAERVLTGYIGLSN